MSGPSLRRHGGRWRLLVHEPGGTSHSVSSAPDSSSEHRTHHHLPGTEFDELVAGQWLHVEEMARGVWWMRVGGVTLHVAVDRDGRPKRVTVHGPGDYASPVPGCEYELSRSRDTETEEVPDA